MDLKEFISEALVQIISGVADAQEKIASIGGKISPGLMGTHTTLAAHGFIPSGGGTAQVVQFDVALTVKEGSGTKGGIGIVAGIVSLGSTGQSNSENSSVSRVKFGVPVVLPCEG